MAIGGFRRVAGDRFGLIGARVAWVEDVIRIGRVEFGRGFDLGGWSMPYIDDDGARFVRENYARADAFLLGRRTYEIFADYWPHIDPENPDRRRPQQSAEARRQSTLRDGHIGMTEVGHRLACGSFLDCSPLIRAAAAGATT